MITVHHNIVHNGLLRLLMILMYAAEHHTYKVLLCVNC